jgi:hypothetical protein
MRIQREEDNVHADLGASGRAANGGRVLSAFRAWRTDDVYLRFLEAAEAFNRMPMPKGPKGFGAAMPAIMRTLEEDEVPLRDPTEWSFDRRRPPATGPMIRRAEEVLDWANTYLAGQSGMKRCLWHQVICAVSGSSFAAFCRKRGWARATVYRRIDQALQMVTDHLNADEVSIEEADLASLEQVRQISIPKRS